MISYDFNEWQFSEFKRKSGHIIVRMSVPTQQKEPSSVQLIFDTGAYLTVISKLTAVRFKLPIGTGQRIRVRGFSGKQGYIDGELLEIPCIMLGRYFAYDVKVVVPLDDTTITEVLGENILEYFIYVVDHEKNLIYFKKNPVPRPYINAEKGIDLSCSKVLLVSDEED